MRSHRNGKLSIGPKGAHILPRPHIVHHKRRRSYLALHMQPRNAVKRKPLRLDTVRGVDDEDVCALRRGTGKELGRVCGVLAEDRCGGSDGGVLREGEQFGVGDDLDLGGGEETELRTRRGERVARERGIG